MSAVGGVLLYSPLLGGHRQTYCQVMADVVREAGERVVVAGAFAELPEASRDAFVAKLRRRGHVELVDTSRAPGGGRDITLGQLTRLVRERGVGLTVLVEADDHLPLLCRQIAPGRRLPGRRVGVFLRSTRYVHIGRSRESLYATARRWRHGRSRWDRDPYLFHERLLPRFGLLDAALCLDETFVAGHGAPHEWLPDVFAGFDGEDWALDPDDEVMVERLERFVERVGDGPLLTYFGRAQARHGYLDVLRLAASLEGYVAHVGTRPPVPGEEAEVDRLRERLVARAALFETDRAAAGFEAGRRLFGAARCVVLPYRRHYGSSGIMLQALDARRPVLVPAPGLMAVRTRSCRLGRTYPEGSFAELQAGFERLWGEGSEPYEDGIDSFMGRFRKEEVEGALRHAFALGGAAARLPHAALTGVA